MSPQDALAIFAAGLAAGTVNVIVGSGSLITFPTLLALGYPPVLANVSNTVGLVPGSVSAVVAYRRELVGQRPRLLQLGSASLLGGLSGAILLLSLPHSVFKAAVPVLIAVAALLMAAQPRISAGLERRGSRRTHGGAGLLAGVFLTGIYGGYFGAAQGSSSSPCWPSSSTTTCNGSTGRRTLWPSSSTPCPGCSSSPPPTSPGRWPA